MYTLKPLSGFFDAVGLKKEVEGPPAPSEKSFWERTKETFAKGDVARNSMAIEDARTVAAAKLASRVGLKLAGQKKAAKKASASPNYMLYGALAGGALLLIMLMSK